MSLGLIDTPEKAAVAGHQFRQADVDLIFLYVTTYALSATVLPVVRRAKVPVIVLNLAPAAAIDYEWFNALGDRTKMTGEWLAYCQSCSVPEIANVFRRAGISFHQITGMLDDDPLAWDEISDWIDAARVAYVMEHNRLGVMGHYYSGMLDIYTDLTQQCAGFGGHIEIVEVDELAVAAGGGHGGRGARSGRPLPRGLRRAARLPGGGAGARGADHRWPSTGWSRPTTSARSPTTTWASATPPNEDAISSIILGNSLLTARGVPMAGEMEIKNVQAMKILDTFGVGGLLHRVLRHGLQGRRGAHGPRRPRASRGSRRARPRCGRCTVYHGKVGRGLSVEMSVKHGPVTVLSVVQTGDRQLKLLVAEGESVPGPTLEIGNTNSRYRFPIGARAYVNEWSGHGPAHHCAVGVGHVASKIEKLGRLLGMDVARIC